MWVSIALLMEDGLAVETLGVSIYTAAMTKWEKCSRQEIIRIQFCLHLYLCSWAEVKQAHFCLPWNAFSPSSPSLSLNAVTSLIPTEVKGEFCSLICYEHINMRRIWLVAFLKAFCITIYWKESQVEELSISAHKVCETEISCTTKSSQPNRASPSYLVCWSQHLHCCFTGFQHLREDSHWRHCVLDQF